MLVAPVRAAYGRVLATPAMVSARGKLSDKVSDNSQRHRPTHADTAETETRCAPTDQASSLTCDRSFTPKQLYPRTCARHESGQTLTDVS